MRVLLATYGSRGDVQPFVGLAMALKSRGADVRICAPPDEEFAALFSRFGLPILPFPRTWRSWAEQPSTAEEKVFNVDDFVNSYITATYSTVAEAARGCDVLVASGMLHFIAGTVAENVGIPHKFVLFSPSLLGTQPWHELILSPINAHRASVGLTPISNAERFLFTEHPLLAVDPILGPLEREQESVVERTPAWLVEDETPLPSQLMAFLNAGSPPVYLGFGSMRILSDSARIAIQAVRRQGRRVVIARGWSDLAPIDEQDDCFSVGEVNQRILFPQVAAVLHHGGAGTTTTAAVAGVPQVIVPQAADQPYWATRIDALGIGAAHPGPTPTLETLSTALERALDPVTLRASSKLAGDIREDGAAVAAELIIASAERRSTA